MTKPYDWREQFSHVEPDIKSKFVSLDPESCGPILEQRGLPRVTGESKESAENRVFVFDDIVLKVFRPGRWSKAALEEEVTFLEDLREAGVAAVRPIGGIQTWQGLHHLAYERVEGPYEEDRPVLSQAQVEQLVALTTAFHRVGAQRDAIHRPRIEPVTMGEGLLDVIHERGYLPASVAEGYEQSVRSLCARAESMLEGVPQQRIHADLGTWNVLWCPEGPLLMDLDDFQVGPVALDVRLLSFPWRLETIPESTSRKERREEQHKLIVSLYRKEHEYANEWEVLAEPLSLLRSLIFDAWFSHNWDEPRFQEHYPEDDITQEAYWEESMKGMHDWLQSV